MSETLGESTAGIDALDIQFEDVDDSAFTPTPDDVPPIASTDLVCETCGKALSYGGRGRKPRFCDEHKSSARTTSTRSGSKDVDIACQQLAMLYGVVQVPMVMLGLEHTASAWEAQIDGLNARNRGILEGDPKLAKRIASTMSTGGEIALILSHAIAIMPVAKMGYDEFQFRRLEAAAGIPHA